MDKEYLDIEFYIDPVPHVIINNFYNEQELKEIWLELDFLTNKRKMFPPEVTGTAKTPEGKVMKDNWGIFLDQTYGVFRNTSNILHHNRKTFKKEFIEAIGSLHWVFRYLSTINKDQTLLSYYEENHYYEGHTDAAVLTALQWFNKEPKAFTGGDLVLIDYDYTIPYENNKFILFPSCVRHAVTPVKMNPDTPRMVGYGRYVVSQFMSFRDPDGSEMTK